MTRRTRLAALLAAATLALAACSGSGGSPAPATAVPPTAATPTAQASDAPPASDAPSAPASEAPAGAAACETVDGGTGTPAEIKGFAFPASLTVQAGQSITWTNADSAPHTVTFDDGSCGTQVGPGASVTVRYDVAGTFAFHCAIHPRMTGTLVVEG